MENINHQEVAERIRSVMKRLGLNQAALANALGTTQPAISKYLNERMPPVEVVYHLARLGKVTMEWLLTGEDGVKKMKVAESRMDYTGEIISQEQISRIPRHVQEALQVIIDHLMVEGR